MNIRVYFVLYLVYTAKPFRTILTANVFDLYTLIPRRYILVFKLIKLISDFQVLSISCCFQSITSLYFFSVLFKTACFVICVVFYYCISD